MKARVILAMLVLAVAISCSHVYKEYDKASFPTYAWKYGQEVTFKPTIEDVNKSYSLVLGLRHLYGFQLNTLSVTVRVISPSGRETSKEYEIRIKEADGTYISKCGGDLCDIETVVESSLKFEEVGTYQYVVTHNVQANAIPGVMEFGLIINDGN